MASDFAARFASTCRTARRRLLLRHAISGTCVGATAATITLLLSRTLPTTWGLPTQLVRLNAAMWESPTTWTATCLVALLLGALGGIVRAVALRPNEEQIALYLDRELGAAQQLPAALTLTASSSWRDHLQRRANEHLTRALDLALLPKPWQRHHWTLVAAVAVAILTLQLPPPLPATAHEAGSKALKLDQQQDLITLERLDQTTGVSERTRAELSAVTEQARRLRKKLEQGVSQREALADVAQLQNTVSESLSELNSPEQRAGLEAAVLVLRQRPLTSAAAAALESLDAKAFDEEMRRLSSAEERAARQAAERALAEAEQRARALGAEAVEKQLSEQQELWQHRTDAAERVRDLIRHIEQSKRGDVDDHESLSTDGQQNAPSADGQQNAPSADGQRVELTPGQDEGEAERLADGLEHGTADFDVPTTDRLERASRLASRKERQALTKALSQLREPSPSAHRQQALLDASRALSRLQNTLSERSTPLPSAIPGPDNPAANDRDKQGAPSSGERGESGEHVGRSERIESNELQAKTEQSMDLRHGRTTATVGRSAATATRETLVPTPKAVRALGPEQIESVERARVPAEYREQVSRYFSAD